jgi:hypothetical protein
MAVSKKKSLPYGTGFFFYARAAKNKDATMSFLVT